MANTAPRIGGFDIAAPVHPGQCPHQPATFGTAENLKINNLGVGYTLAAQSPDTSPTATVFSNPFNIANAVTPCSGNCKSTAVDQFDNITATATGLSGKLSITMINANPACAGISTQVGSFDTVNPTNPTGSSPTLEITGTLVHRSNKGGIGNTVICKNTGPGMPLHPVQLCTKTKNVPPCLAKLSGNGQGDVFFDLIAKYNPVTGQFDPGIVGGH